MTPSFIVLLVVTIVLFGGIAALVNLDRTTRRRRDAAARDVEGDASP